jgi:tetratricopeptide (TPR) repeat protein
VFAHRRTPALGFAVALVVAFTLVPRPSAASSAEELARIARSHEAAGHDDVAARRYTEALALDPTLGEAYLGLAALRARNGDAREAERVLSMALEHVPSLTAALAARARVRRGLGDHDGAFADLEAFTARVDDAAPLRELAGWYGTDGRAPAQLGVWRRLQVLAARSGDAALAREARTMVRALQIIVAPADPVSTPPEAGDLRRTIAAVARRGG